MRESTLPNAGSTNDDTGALAVATPEPADTTDGATSRSASMAIKARFPVMPGVIAESRLPESPRGVISVSVNTQLEPKDRSAADLALEAHAPAVSLDDIA